MRTLLLRVLRSLSRLDGWARYAVQFGVDTVMLTGCFVLAMVLRLDDFRFVTDVRPWIAFAVALPLTLAVFVGLGFYRAVIRHITSRAVNAVLVGAVLGGVGLFAVSQGFRLAVPRSVPFIYAVLMLVSVGGLRFLVRALFRWERMRLKAPVIIYGAGEAGRQLQMSLQLGPEYSPIAFVDDDADLRGREIGGLRVHDPSQLERLIADYSAEAVLLAIPSASHTQRQAIISRLENLPVRVQTIPGMADIVSGREKLDILRQISAEDLLGRDPVQPMGDLMDRNIRGKVVLVTGAGGSIGSELCRQILNRRPKTLVLYDSAEFALYAIEQDLRRLARARKIETTVVPLLGSVGDRARLASILRRFQTETIYHAAAYKHVPIVEENVVAGIQNNVFGTRVLAEEAVAAGVDSLILISTDKAVRPTSIMGASKRMAELVCQAIAAGKPRTRFSIVRFGNVLESSGSVVPLFKRQIEQGGPLTVTHPEITRYFMTIPEAAQLVIQAGAMGSGGEVFLLDMGEPVRIVDLAQRMARFSGLKAVLPGTDPSEITAGSIEITFTGLRPGEKLYEELLIDANAVTTAHPRIRAASEIHLDWPVLEPILAALSEACAALSVGDIHRILSEAPTGYVTSGAIADLVWRDAPGRP